MEGGVAILLLVIIVVVGGIAGVVMYLTGTGLWGRRMSRTGGTPRQPPPRRARMSAEEVARHDDDAAREVRRAEREARRAERAARERRT